MRIPFNKSSWIVERRAPYTWDTAASTHPTARNIAIHNKHCNALGNTQPIARIKCFL